MESSPSGSGLSQPLKPFFLKVWEKKSDEQKVRKLLEELQT